MRTLLLSFGLLSLGLVLGLAACALDGAEELSVNDDWSELAGSASSEIVAMRLADGTLRVHTGERFSFEDADGTLVIDRASAESLRAAAPEVWRAYRIMTAGHQVIDASLDPALLDRPVL